MITSNMSGNSGNQNMVYVITRVVADKNGYEFGFNPVPEYDYYRGMSQQDFFDISYGTQHNYKYDETPPWVTNIWQEKKEVFNYPNGDSVNFYDYQPDIFNVPDQSKLIIGCCQDARYFEGYKEKIKQWLKIKDEKQLEYSKILNQLGIELDENLTVLNIRGGEYLGIPHVLLRKEYWNNAMKHMLERNHKSHFLVVSDDIHYASNLFNHAIPVVHISIGGDYYILNNAKNLILSNSSFAIFPTWLNNNNPYVVSPKFWARHNVSTGYWCSSHIETFGWNFMDREGKIA